MLIAALTLLTAAAPCPQEPREERVLVIRSQEEQPVRWRVVQGGAQAGQAAAQGRAVRQGQVLEVRPLQEGRAWLGVELTDSPQDGIDVARVSPGSPAERAGLRQGDRLLSLDEAPTDSYESVVALLAQHKPDARVRVRIARSVELELEAEHRTEDGRLALGVALRSSAEGREQLRVDSVSEGYPAARAGLRPGDVIAVIGDRRLEGYDSLVERMREQREPGRVRVTFERELSIRLGAAPRESAAPVAPDAVVPSPSPTPRARAVQPPATRAQPPTPDAQLQRELRALADELKALRDELAQLRAQLAELRRERRQ